MTEYRITAFKEGSNSIIHIAGSIRKVLRIPLPKVEALLDTVVRLVHETKDNDIQIKICETGTGGAIKQFCDGCISKKYRYLYKAYQNATSNKNVVLKRYWGSGVTLKLISQEAETVNPFVPKTKKRETGMLYGA